MHNLHVQGRKCTWKPVERVSNAFYFVDNLHENGLGNVYSLNLKGLEHAILGNFVKLCQL